MSTRGDAATTWSEGAPHANGAPKEGDVLRRFRVTARIGIFALAGEELVLEAARPEVGRAVALVSGGRLAFRRVLAVNGRELRLRADVAPFGEAWDLDVDGDVVGCVRPRLVDRLAAAVDVERWTRLNWATATALARAEAVRRRAKPVRRAALHTRELTDADWPDVRRFWKASWGRELHVAAQPHQHVIGLFDGRILVGANIHLVFGKASYSAFTLVDRSYRGAGGGVKMIRSAVELAEKLGLESIYVHINVRNLPSIRAYRTAGFVERGWWTDDADPLASAERQWRVLELDLTTARR